MTWRMRTERWWERCIRLMRCPIRLRIRRQRITDELPVDVALGKLDYMEIVGFSDHKSTAAVWYKLLNLGFRVPAGAGTDATTNYAAPIRGQVGMNRVYALVPNEPAGVGIDAWLNSLKKGRTFATNSPLIEFTLGGLRVGDELKFESAQAAVPFTAKLRSIVPVDHLEVVCNGRVTQTLKLEGKRDAADVTGTLQLTESGWCVLRASSDGAEYPVLDNYVYATTSPVYVTIGGKAPRSPEDAKYFAAWIARMIEVTAHYPDWNSAAEKEYVLKRLGGSESDLRKVSYAPSLKRRRKQMRNHPLFLGSAIVLLLAAPLALLHAQTSPKYPYLQKAVESAMEGRGGAAVVADVSTGEILAAQRMELAAHRLARPGSTVKPFVLMALLESEKIDANERLLCRRPLRIGTVRMDCAHASSIVELNAEEAIAYSCNSYFAEAATRLSGAELVQTLRKAGLDSPSGLVKEEASGRIETARDREMLQLEALGDRGIEVTALELLGAYRRLALQKRSGAAANERGAGPAPTDRDRDAAVFAGLEESVAYGMAHAANVEGVKIAGKTGTAASRENARTHGFFVGYAPAEKPEIVVVIYLEQGNGGDAAGVARAIFAAAAKGGWLK